jgi:hypothetical protein
VAMIVVLAGAWWDVANALDIERTMKFAAEMAERGNWREARFRWESVARERPDDPKVLNNLAVAAEALGDRDEADRLYDRARAAAPDDPRIARNAAASRRFRESTEGGQTGTAEAGWGTQALEPERKAKKGNVLELSVRLPLPPKLRLAGMRSLLVASFLANGEEMMDTNREIVRFLRSEFRKHSALEILDVTPPPPVPEQTLEDMIGNSGFWKYLGREHGADLVVSGVLRYDRRDASGFRDVDLVSPTTGQKVKTTRFTEQQEFRFELDVLFFRGLDGSLLYRDRFRRSTVYAGTANDPISAFYDLANRIAEDVSSVVSPAHRYDPRTVFVE